MLAEGSRIDRYELICPVGEGGMAQVWVASQQGKHGFEKLFALKSIHPRFADDAGFRGMFLDEARIASAIQHPNVAQVFDLGEADQLLYLVMEYVEGESLSALSTTANRRGTPIPIAVALRIAADVAAGVHSAHRLRGPTGELRGVVHRDVSPHNILVSLNGEVKVIDFGIAHAKDRWGKDTDAGGVKGKAGYMAPEQARRQPLTARTDVFALGATLYRLLSHDPPFWAGNDLATLARLLSGPPPDPLPETVPPLVRAIVERALELDPDDRYESAQAMQNALEGAIVEEGYVPNVATFVRSNLSDRARERHALLSKRGSMVKPPATLTPVKSPSIPEHAVPDVPDLDLGVGPTHAAPPLPVPVAGTVPLAPPLRPREPPPPPDHDETKTPGFMDVRALVAARSRGHQGDIPPAHRPPPPDAYQGHHAPPRQGGPPIARLLPDPPPPLPSPSEPAQAKDPAPKRELVGPSTPAKPKNEIHERGSAWVKLAVAATVAVLLVVGVLLVLPRVIQSRIVDNARAAGVYLTIESVGVSFSGITLRNVTAKAAALPSATAKAEEVVSVGFSGKEVRIRGGELTLDGTLTETSDAVRLFYDQARAAIAGTPSEPRKISVGSSRITWNGLLGPGTRFVASDAGLDLETRGVGTEDLRGSLGRFEVTTKKTTIGPWATSFESNAQSSRIRLLFDPPVPDGPSLLVVWGKTAPVNVTVKIPRSPLQNLGIRPGDLGLPADPSTELEVKAEGGKTPGGRIEATINADLHRARLPSLTTPLDIKLAANVSGVPGKPLDLEKTTITIGPFVVAVSGNVTPQALGFRIDATWKTLPIACDKIVRAEAKSWGQLAATIQELAHATGVARVTGTASASGLVQYDTGAPDEASMTWLTKESCGLSFFGM